MSYTSKTMGYMFIHFLSESAPVIYHINIASDQFMRNVNEGLL